MTAAPIVVVVVLIAAAGWTLYGAAREAARGGPTIDEIVGPLARRASLGDLIRRALRVNDVSKAGGPKTATPDRPGDRQWRIDVYVVCVLGFNLLGTWLLEARWQSGDWTTAVAIAVSLAGFLLATASVAYLYGVLEGREVRSALRSAVLALVNLGQVGAAYGNAYFLLWLWNPGWWTGEHIPNEPTSAVLLSIREQFGQSGPTPNGWLAGGAVLAHGWSLLFILVLVVGAAANALMLKPEGKGTADNVR